MVVRLALALSVVISACGLSIEPRSTPSPVPEAAIPEPTSTSQLQVLVSLPTDLALAKPDVVIKLVFSASMDPTASNQAFSLTAATGETIAGEIFWDVESRVLAFRPRAALPTGEFFILVDEGAKSRVGVALAEPFSASFSVPVDLGPEKNTGG